MEKIAIFCSLLIGTFCSAFAQKVSLHSINEQRSTSEGFYSNRCEIELKITGDEVRKYKFAKIASVGKVIDDQDLDLWKEDENEFEYEEIDDMARVRLVTKNPSRKATEIKELSGEIYLFNATEANGGMVKVANYQSKANVNLLPESAGVKVVYLTKASLDKFAKEQKAATNKLTGVAKELVDLLQYAVESFSDFGEENNQVSFIFDGDESKLVDLYFEDATGKKIERNGYTKMNNMISYYYDEQPEASWKLVMNVETPGSIKKVPFTLTKIDLP